MIRMTLDCVRPMQFSVIQTIYCNVGQEVFLFQFYQNVCSLLSFFTKQYRDTFTVWWDL